MTKYINYKNYWYENIQLNNGIISFVYDLLKRDIIDISTIAKHINPTTKKPNTIYFKRPISYKQNW